MRCDRIEPVLTRYLLGDLDKSTESEVREHLSACEGCRAAVGELEPTLGLLRNALAAPSHAPERLSAEHRARIFKARRRDIIRFSLLSIARVAAVVLIGFVLAGLFVPTLMTSRHVALPMKGTFGHAEELFVLHETVGGKSSTESTVTEPLPPPPRAQTKVTRSETKEVQVFAETPMAQATSTRLTVDAPSSYLRMATPMVAPTVKPADIKIMTDSTKKIEVAKLARRASGRDSHDSWGESAPKSATADLPVARDWLPPLMESEELEGGIPMPPGRAGGKTYAENAGAEEASARSVEGGTSYRWAVGVGNETRVVAGLEVAAQPADKKSVDSYGYYKGAVEHQDDSSLARVKAEVETELKKYRTSYGQYPEQDRARDELEDALDEAGGIGDGDEVAETRITEKATPARFTPAGINPFVDTKTNPFSTFAIDVDTASYTLTRNYMLHGTLPPPEAVRTEEFVNFFDYGQSAPKDRAFAVYAESGPTPFARGLSLLKIGVKGRHVGREEGRPAILTFLIDTSGSMSTPDRMGLVKQALRLLVERLGPNDRVTIVQYDSSARLVLEHTAASEKARILEKIDSMQTSGSTNLEEGMKLAYEIASRGFVAGASNRVLLLSDGAANLGAVAAEEILKSVERFRKQGIYCSVYGVGIGTYDDTMLETLANKGDGSYVFMDSMDEARRVFVDELGAALNVIASDVKIQVEFNPSRVKSFRQIGYENRRLRKEDFRDDKVDAGEVGSGQSVTALYELELNESSREPIGTVRIRYREEGSGRIEEISQPLNAGAIRKTFEDSSVSFRLACSVAAFAEILRGSPYVVGTDYEDVARVLRPVALDLSMDSRVQELLRLVQSAESMPRAE